MHYYCKKTICRTRQLHHRDVVLLEAGDVQGHITLLTHVGRLVVLLPLHRTLLTVPPLIEECRDHPVVDAIIPKIRYISYRQTDGWTDRQTITSSDP